MARLSASDYRRALEVVYAAGEIDGPIAFPEPVLEALARLVPCDVVAFHDRGDIVYTGEPKGPLTPEIRAARRRFAHQDPRRPADGPRTVEDFGSTRDFRRTDLYQYVDRPLGIDHMLQMYVDPRVSDARLEFDRSETAFRVRDRAVLELLLPHLRQCSRRAGRRRAAANLSPREREILEHVSQGRTNAEI